MQVLRDQSDGRYSEQRLQVKKIINPRFRSKSNNQHAISSNCQVILSNHGHGGQAVQRGPVRPEFVDRKKQLRPDDSQSAISDVSESLDNSSDLSVVDSQNCCSELVNLKAEIERMQAEFNKEFVKDVKTFTRKSKKNIQK